MRTNREGFFFKKKGETAKVVNSTAEDDDINCAAGAKLYLPYQTSWFVELSADVFCFVDIQRLANHEYFENGFYCLPKVLLCIFNNLVKMLSFM